jgi:hypothetical protein
MKNRSRTHTPVDLENQICIGELTEIRDVVDWCTKILLDTPLAPLITADPAIEVINRDILPAHERNCGSYGLSSTTGRIRAKGLIRVSASHQFLRDSMSAWARH